MRRIVPNRERSRLCRATSTTTRYQATPTVSAYSRSREPSASHDCPYRDLKRVLLIAAAILAARKLSGFDRGKRILILTPRIALPPVIHDKNRMRLILLLRGSLMRRVNWVQVAEDAIMRFCFC